MTKNNQLFIPISYGKRLLLLTLMFFVMSVLASFSVQFAKQIFDEGTRNYMLLASSLQALIMFVAPAFASSFFISQTPMRILGLNKSVNIRNILGIILMFVLVMPALNQVIWWNSQLSLPDALKDVETWMREMESNAAEMQSILLSSTTIGGLISSILVVGVLTGFAEEVFFRGALQRIISSNGMNPHMAIFIAAFIFSLFLPILWFRTAIDIRNVLWLHLLLDRLYLGLIYCSRHQQLYRSRHSLPHKQWLRY